jgi:hypothetical protein
VNTAIGGRPSKDPNNGLTIGSRTSRSPAYNKPATAALNGQNRVFSFDGRLFRVTEGEIQARRQQYEPARLATCLHRQRKRNVAAGRVAHQREVFGANPINQLAVERQDLRVQLRCLVLRRQRVKRDGDRTSKSVYQFADKVPMQLGDRQDEAAAVKIEHVMPGGVRLWFYHIHRAFLLDGKPLPEGF